MKHDTECVLIPLRELVALATNLGITIPQSLTDRVNHMPAIPAAKAGTTTLGAGGAPIGANTFAFAAPLPGVTPGDVLLIGSELMFVQAVLPPVTPVGAAQTVEVVRGYGGTTAAAQAGGAAVAFATMTGLQLAKDIVNDHIIRRSDTRAGYAWPFPAMPPSWLTKPGQIGGPAGAVAMTSEQAGVVIPAAPSTGTPNPSPPPSGRAQPDGGAS